MANVGQDNDVNTDTSMKGNNMLSAIAMIISGIGSVATGGLGLAVLPDAPVDVAAPLGE